MSETYTIGGDSLIKFDNPVLAGQTFRPLETHTLDYIDLNLRGPLMIPEPVILVYNADINHKPTGDYISRNRFTTESASWLLGTGRVRFSMQPFTLIKDNYYAIVAGNYPGLLGTSAYWQYDADGAQYPRGLRISSPDHGDTWEIHYDSDHIFAEFGTPPLPKPEPPPPIPNFAAVDISFLHFNNAILIYLSTSVPCHLSLYYTDKQPLKHHVSRILRGAKVPWATYFCFVAWQTAQQLEPGDSLYHTFLIPDWSFYQLKWFTIRGQIDFIDSPSVGPIFSHTNTGQDLIKNPSFEVFTNPPNPPDDWLGGGPPGQPPVFYPDAIDKTDGLQSCLARVTRLYSLQDLWQFLNHTHLSNLQLTFRVSYKGALEWFNGLRIRAWGDTTTLVLARPTLDYQWEDLTATITMPNNLYKLEFLCRIDNQGQPVPWDAWWDNCRVYLGLPP